MGYINAHDQGIQPLPAFPTDVTNPAKRYGLGGETSKTKRKRASTAGGATKARKLDKSGTPHKKASAPATPKKSPRSQKVDTRDTLQSTEANTRL